MISGEYYYINGQMVCPSCAVQARTGQSSDSQIAYACALFFGVGGAILGSILCAGFALTTQMTASFFALAVGWIVGKSMKYGSNGLGGGRYQFTALVLTHFAVSFAAIPVNLYAAYSQSDAATNWVALLPQIALWGIASPFLDLNDLGSDPLNLAVRFASLLFGFVLAWKITQPRPLSVAGPYGLMEP